MGIMGTVWANEQSWDLRQEKVIKALLVSFDKFNLKEEREIFERNQKAWVNFSKKNCEELYLGFKGGTAHRSMLQQCNDRSIRTRLRELRAVYFQTWPKPVNDEIDQWINPPASDSEDKWVLFKSSDELCKSPPNGWEVSADFDGNGKQDVARLEDNEQQKKRRLAVWLNENATPVVLEEQGLRYAGNYLTVKTPGTVNPFIDSSDKTPVKIEYDSIVTGSCESSEMIYYYDKVSRKFKQVWTGD